MKKAVCISLFVFIALGGGYAAASDAPPSFTQLSSFPALPNASGPWGGYAYGIAADTLGDGRYILYDGNEILIQNGVGLDGFTSVASGYVGDPGFIAVAPDGHTCLVGAGYSGEFWLFDADSPANAGTPIYTHSHFWGVWVSNTHIAIDAAPWVGPGAWDYAAEVGILNISGTPAYAKVVDKGGVGTNSAAVALDPSGSYLYACEAATAEYRRFAVGDLITAAGTKAVLPWTTGTLIGTYPGVPGGVYATSEQGTLLCGGYLDSIEFIDPVSGTPAGSADPNGNYVSYSIVYNDETNEILAIGNQSLYPNPNAMTAYVSDGAYEPLPAAGGAALAIMIGACAVLGGRRLRRVARS